MNSQQNNKTPSTYCNSQVLCFRGSAAVLPPNLL
ncbi:hypothetical protein T08_16602 [Trichinella sp. T8]|nr:hypothetical protein T08_16602 [Trichinella sp. T8]